MWKKIFIRFGFVMLIATMGLLVVAASHKNIQAKKECNNTEEKCTQKSAKGQGEFIIWESFSRTVLSVVNH